jgi:hypothetical protein
MTDHWKGQSNYVEVWVEKDALVGVVGSICNKLDVPYFSCRGYVSQSEMWGAAQRLREIDRNNRYTHIIHLGDHDPSGIDMTRDIEERLSTFGSHVEIHRIALTMEQIRTFNPPPNPTKLTDARAKGYIRNYGQECWELDALEPSVITELIKNKVTEFCDTELRDKILFKQELQKSEISLLANNYDRAISHLRS